MDIITLMGRFADPQTLAELTLAQKMTASLVTTLLGMGITFISLIILQFVIGLLARFAADKPAAVSQPAVATSAGMESAPIADQPKSDHELVAAITVALAAQLGTSTGNIVIRNIKKIDDHTPAWSRTGLAELMDNHV